LTVPLGACAISRFPGRPGSGGPPQRTRINHFIRITPIRLIGAGGEQVGVVETPQALRMAEELGLDLVEISPEARPPVCKIMDYGKFKYEQSKQKKTASNKGSELKEVRLGRSIKIDPHDVEIRVKQARKFLIAGNKVMITQRFRGREMAHRDLGIQRLREIADKLAEVGKLESPPRWNGPSASILFAPDKAKIEAIKRQEARARAMAEAEAKRLGKTLPLPEPEPEEPEELDDDDDDDDNDDLPEGLDQPSGPGGHDAAKP
jgi:translation initiation factor IF-3